MGMEEHDRDIERYRPDEAPPEARDAISDIGYRAEGSAGGSTEGDIGGYRDGHPATRVSQEEFQRDMPLFQDSGFESIEEYLEYLEDEWRKVNGLEPLPSAELTRQPTPDEKGAKQVGLRLPGRDYELLLELCDRYGVPPATMARILVVRAVRRASDFSELDDGG